MSGNRSCSRRSWRTGRKGAGVVLLEFTARREHDLVTAMQGSATVKIPQVPAEAALANEDG